MATTSAKSPSYINIWENTPVKKSVKLTPYLAGNNSPAIIVCPGGSYFWLARKTEGHDVAKWLQTNGISAFVLEYRTAGINAFIYHTRLFYRGNRYPDMLQDVQQALHILRVRAGEFHINPNEVGVMGFSAGGHLAVLAAVNSKNDFLKTLGVKVETQSQLAPDFVAPIYPVVSLSANSSHKRSRRGLLGEFKKSDNVMRDSLSLEKRISPGLCPVFLMNCKDDPIVKWQNSQLLDSALTANNVNHRYIFYQTGGHGFGASADKTTPEAAAWKEEFLKWFDETVVKKNH